MFAAGWLLGKIWTENNKTIITNENLTHNGDKEILKNAICTFIHKHPNCKSNEIAQYFNMNISRICGYLVQLQKEERIKKQNGAYILIEGEKENAQ